MLDDAQRLQENPHLLVLLTHYAQMGTGDRATWRDRLMQMEGVEPRQLSVLHGELIAFDWIEQNSGQALMLQNGTLSACYRITLNGLREYRRIHGVEVEEETPERPQPRFARKKKEKAEMLAVATPEELLVPGEKIEVECSESPEKSRPRFPGKKKQKSDSPEAIAVVASEESLASVS